MNISKIVVTCLAILSSQMGLSALEVQVQSPTEGFPVQARMNDSHYSSQSGYNNPRYDEGNYSRQYPNSSNSYNNNRTPMQRNYDQSWDSKNYYDQNRNSNQYQGRYDDQGAMRQGGSYQQMNRDSSNYSDPNRNSMNYQGNYGPRNEDSRGYRGYDKYSANESSPMQQQGSSGQQQGSSGQKQSDTSNPAGAPAGH